MFLHENEKDSCQLTQKSNTLVECIIEGNDESVERLTFQVEKPPNKVSLLDVKQVYFGLAKTIGIFEVKTVEPTSLNGGDMSLSPATPTQSDPNSSKSENVAETPYHWTVVTDDKLILADLANSSTSTTSPSVSSTVAPSNVSPSLISINMNNNINNNTTSSSISSVSTSQPFSSSASSYSSTANAMYSTTHHSISQHHNPHLTASQEILMGLPPSILNTLNNMTSTSFNAGQHHHHPHDIASVMSLSPAPFESSLLSNTTSTSNTSMHPPIQQQHQHQQQQQSLSQSQHQQQQHLPHVDGFAQELLNISGGLMNSHLQHSDALFGTMLSSAPTMISHGNTHTAAVPTQQQQQHHQHHPQIDHLVLEASSLINQTHGLLDHNLTNPIMFPNHPTHEHLSAPPSFSGQPVHPFASVIQSTGGGVQQPQSQSQPQSQQQTIKSNDEPDLVLRVKPIVPRKNKRYIKKGEPGYKKPKPTYIKKGQPGYKRPKYYYVRKTKPKSPEQP